MSCYCDYDRPEVHVVTNPVARSRHTCCECGHRIIPGETYEKVVGKWDGEFSTIDTCHPCADLRDALAELNGGCFQYGGLREEYWEYLSSLYLGREDVDRTMIFDAVMAKHRAGPALT